MVQTAQRLKENFFQIKSTSRYTFFRESTKSAETPTKGVELHTYVAFVAAENKNDLSGVGGRGWG
jgi:hypothetical protein